MATSNLFLALDAAQRRAVSAADRVQRYGEALEALWAKIDRLEGTRERSEKGWLTRYRREYATLEKRERRAVRDFEREVERANTFERELKQRQRETAIERRKQKAKAKAEVKRPEPPAKKGAKKPQRRKRVFAGYEYVLKVRYKPKQHRAESRHHSVWWDVRLKKTDGTQAKPSELRTVVQHIKTHGEAPRGWDATGIRWDRGARHSWNDTPARDAETNGMDVSAVLASLSHTLPTRGADEGQAYEIGEERREDGDDASE